MATLQDELKRVIPAVMDLTFRSPVGNGTVTISVKAGELTEEIEIQAMRMMEEGRQPLYLVVDVLVYKALCGEWFYGIQQTDRYWLAETLPEVWSTTVGDLDIVVTPVRYHVHPVAGLPREMRTLQVVESPHRELMR